MKLLGSAKSKITKNENDENVAYLQITEVASYIKVLSIISINKTQESCIDLFVPTKQFGQLLDVSRKSFMFLKTLNS